MKSQDTTSTNTKASIATSTLVHALDNPLAFGHPLQNLRLIETHISWIILTGSYAYKIKKAVNLGFLDFSTLESVLPNWNFYALSNNTNLKQRIADASIIISNKVSIDEAAFAAAPNLKLVCVAATGTNNINIEAANHHGVVVCNVRGYATASVTQHVFTVMLALMTQLGKYRRAVKKGDWQQSPHFSLLDYPIHEIAGKTLGIIGYGELGQAVARIGEAFGMNVLVAEQAGRSPRPGR